VALQSSTWSPDGHAWQEERIEVSTSGASGIGTNSATLNGFVSSLGPYHQVEVWFEGNGVSSPHQVMSAPGPFSYHVGGLQPGTQYQYTAIAGTNLIGGQTARGATVEFTTQHTVPQAPVEVQTSSASSVTSSTAVLYGYLSNPGPYNTVRCNFQYGTSPNFGNTTGGQDLYGPGPFSLQISGLSPNTTYYFRSMAKPDVVGVSAVYGSTVTFTTSGAASISVSTGAESNITSNSATIVGYLNSLGSYPSATVWFQWGPSTGYGQTTTMQTMYSPGAFNFTLYGLAPGSTYHFRAMGTSGTASGPVVNGRDSQFSTNFSPGVVVNTGQAADISASSASLNGYITSFGSGGSANVWFEYGTDPSFGNSTPQQTMTTPGSFRFSVTRLMPGMTYYFRAAAYASGFTTYGQSSSFQTTSGSPVSISTGAASGLTTSSANLNAYINSLGSARSASAYFNFGKTTDMGMTTSAQPVGGPGPVTSTVSGLLPGTEYYFQAVAQTPDGNKSYGSVDTFTTIGESKITVSTQPAGSITSSTAVLDGNLDNLGNTSVVQVWFEYGKTADFGNSTAMQTRTMTGPYSTTVTGLAANTTYYFRAMALNPTGGGKTVHGPASSFVTTGSPHPTPPSPPSPEVPVFVWLIGFGFVVIIIILIVLLVSRR
jgi:phosphodiesterase/alkaline phosphatase D-like protein